MVEPSTTEKKILAVFANPRGTSSLRLGEEDRTIRESIQLSEHRDAFKVEAVHAARVDDVARALLKVKPDIVHVSGHGSGSGLILETPSGGIYVVPQRALADLLREYAPPAGTLGCVLLNACYSVAQGKLTSLGVEYTIAMEGTIDDPAAIEFARGFYDAVGAGADYPRAYKEGCLRASLNTPEARWKVCLLRDGQVCAENDSSGAVDQARSLQVAAVPGKDILLGVAIDLSGSMKSSMPNRDSRQISRFDAFQSSLERLISDAEVRLREDVGGTGSERLRSFVYGFGLRIVPHADLLAMLQVMSDSSFRALADSVKERVIARERQKYAGYSGLASLASQFLGQGTVRAIAAQAEDRGREAVFDELRPVLEAKVRDLGDVTVNLADLSARWRRRGGSFKDAEPVLFGGTPMCGALCEISDRFKREIAKCVPGTMPVLFVLSDGEADDGNPGQFASAFKSLGVTVVSCFVSDHDIANPRVVFGKPQAGWSKGAREMFELSSRLPTASEFTSVLLQKGWTIEPDAKLFVQANHSEIVEEFMSIVLGPLGSASSRGLLPPGV